MVSFISPTLPQSLPAIRPPRIVCGRKPRRRPKNPSPPQTRPLPSLPPLPTTALPPTPPPTPRVPASSSKSLIKTLQSRHDAVVLNPTTEAPILTAISCRENSEHTLILLPTRTAALHVAALLSDPANRPRSSRQTRVIVAAGKGMGSWKYPAMNANSSTHSVIVVGTPRAVGKDFFNSHGLPWLGRVRFLVVASVAEMLENGSGRDLHRVVRRIGPNRKTVLVEQDIKDDVEKMTEGWLRPKHGVIQWGGLLSKPTIVDGSVITARPREGLEYLLKLADSRNEGERVLVVFPAARVVEVYATMLRLLGRTVIDVHAKTSLGNRARGLELFKEGGVLLATDTVFDEVDGVDLVVSVGVVEEGIYKRRVEAGKRGVVVVRPEVVEVMRFAGVAQAWEDGNGLVNTDVIREEVGEKARRVAYQALVTFHASWRKRLGWTRPQMVEFVNEWAKELFGEVPEIEKKFAGRKRLIGYKDVRVKRVAKENVAL